MKKIDRYIIKKFLGTFVYAISLLSIIIIIFDISEKIDEFVEKNAPLSEIVFSYYFNFLPYFINLFSALFTFISVIFFTSKMAYNTEIIAILSSGISFRRMLRPFLIAGAIIGLVSFLLSNFIIPHTNQEMMNFQWKYLKDDRRVENKNIHMQIEKGVQIYVESYTTSRNMARKFAIEKYDGNRLVSRTSSDYAKWMPDDKTWRLSNWKRRDVFEDHEVLTHGAILDTSIALNPKDFIINLEDVKTMDWWDLRAFINKEKLKGSSNVMEYEIEKHERIAFPFANIILTLIGVAISSRKIRGGMGMHLGIGMTLTFTYILFMQISTVFSSNGGLEPVVAVWIPNVVFGIISFFLIRYAPK